MANTMQTNKKTIALALGAVTEMSYLYAGADKAIETEMQGKDNGDTIYYKVTQLGDPECDEVSQDGSGTAISGASAIKQVTVPVRTLDSKIMIGVNAYERQVTSLGGDEAKIRARIGQKVGKKAVTKVIGRDVESIGNVFVATQDNAFATFQKAGAFLKGHVDGTIYGWMDWQIWGDLTGKGQQAVPCALAETRFGKDLKGTWTLIDQLRVTSEIATFNAPTTLVSSGATASVSGSTIKIKGTISKGDMFTIEGVYARDVNDQPTTQLYVFKASQNINSTAGETDVTASISNVEYGTVGETVKATAWIAPEEVTSKAVKSVLTAGKTYASCIIRTEGAQAFGVMKNCGCEGAKYEKSEIDGVTVHINSGENLGEFKTDKRFDMLFASKLVEPRAAVLVLYPLN